MTEQITPEPIQEPVSVDDNAGSLTVDNATISVVGGGTEATAQRVTIANDSTGLVSVDDNAGSLTVDNARLDLVGGGTEAAAMRVTIANDSTGVLSVDDNAGTLTVDQATAANLKSEPAGAVAHDGLMSSAVNPLSVGVRADTIADAAVGSEVSADDDITGLRADRDGSLFIQPYGPRQWNYHENSSSALTDASVHAAPAAGLSLYVVSIVCSTGAATALNIFFEEGVTTVLGPYYLEAVAGRGFAINFAVPKKITAATALTVTTSAAIAHSIDVTGFIAPG